MAGMSTSLDRVDEAQEVDALGRIQLPDEAEVEEHEPLRRGLRHEVAGMRVAVEEAVDQDLLDHRPDERRAQGVGVEAGVAQLVRVRDLDARDELHRQDARTPTGRRRRAAR